MGAVVVDSNTWGMRDNKWDNHFTANVEASNGSLEIVEVVEIIGEYKNHGESRITVSQEHTRIISSHKFEFHKPASLIWPDFFTQCRGVYRIAGIL